MRPNKIQKFLGFIYNSEDMTVSLPPEKRLKIEKIAESFKLNKKYKIRQFAEALGFLVSCCPAVNYSCLYTKACEREKFFALENNY